MTDSLMTRNRLEIRLLGLRRSGNHAVLNWAASIFEGPTCFLNDILHKKKVDRCAKSDPLPNLSLGASARLNQNKALLLLSYEDCRILHMKRRAIPESVRGASDRHFDLVLLRDPYNNFASRLKLARDQPKNPFARSMLFPDEGGVEFLRELWKRLAREFIDQTSHLGGQFRPKISLNYNLWVTRKDYRHSIAKLLGGAPEKEAIEAVPAYGFGSSFSGQNFRPSVDSVNLMKRWEHFADDPEYRRMIDDAELHDLASEIFVDTPECLPPWLRSRSDGGRKHQEVDNRLTLPIERRTAAAQRTAPTDQQRHPVHSCKISDEGRYQLRFPHGLGDCSNFAHVLALYGKRGFEFELHCAPHKAYLYSACPNVKINLEGADFPRVDWRPGPALPGLVEVPLTRIYQSNKTAANLSIPPLPDIGPLTESLWGELTAIRIHLTELVSSEDRAKAEEIVDGLPKPIILLHTRGTTFPRRKNLDSDTEMHLYREILHRFDGSIVLLDWNNRVQKMEDPRVRFIGEPGSAQEPLAVLPQLAALIDLADLVVGIDSGPAHFARFTDTPVLGLWNEHHPAKFSLPNPNHIHIVPRRNRPELNRWLRDEYRIIESEADGFDPPRIAETAIAMLQGYGQVDGSIPDIPSL